MFRKKRGASIAVETPPTPNQDPVKDQGAVGVPQWGPPVHSTTLRTPSSAFTGSSQVRARRQYLPASLLWFAAALCSVAVFMAYAQHVTLTFLALMAATALVIVREAVKS